MNYFEEVKEEDLVFGLVYGKGKVKSVWEKDSYYTFEVEYENGSVVPYTSEGYPAWNRSKFTFQTVFNVEDIKLLELDFVPLEKTLSVKKIIKLRNEKKLEVRCPSGIWQNLEQCPKDLIEEYLQENKFHLFRKKI